MRVEVKMSATTIQAHPAVLLEAIQRYTGWSFEVKAMSQTSAQLIKRKTFGQMHAAFLLVSLCLCPFLIGFLPLGYYLFVRKWAYVNGQREVFLAVDQQGQLHITSNRPFANSALWI